MYCVEFKDDRKGKLKGVKQNIVSYFKFNTSLKFFACFENLFFLGGVTIFLDPDQFLLLNQI